MNFNKVPRYTQSIRTLMTDGGNTANWVQPDAMRPVASIANPEVELLNSGRTAEYFLVPVL